MKLLSLLILISFFIVGCSPKTPSVTNNTIYSSNIISLLNGYDIYPSDKIIDDELYTLPSKNWVETTFSNEFFKFLSEEKLQQYELDSNDCDNFAGWARLFAQKLNNNTKSQGKSSILFGEFDYKEDKGGYHAINFFISLEDEKYKIYFYEPQTQKIIFLSDDEIKSCFGITI